MKTSLGALTFLAIGIALGWMLKPTLNAPTPQSTLTTDLGTSIP